MTVDPELVTRKLLLITQDLDVAAPFATKPGLDVSGEPGRSGGGRAAAGTDDRPDD
jgi:hypothetical protein